MAKATDYLKNAIAQLFDEIEDKCKVKFATFTASDTQGQQNIVASREYMSDEENNNSRRGVVRLSYPMRSHLTARSPPADCILVPTARWYRLLKAPPKPR